MIQDLLKISISFTSTCLDDSQTKDCAAVGGDVGVLLLNCSICHLEFISEDGLKKHVEDAHPEVAAKGGKLVVLMRNGGDASTPLRGDVLHPSTLQHHTPSSTHLPPQLQQLQQQRQNLTPSFNPDDSMGEYVDDDDDDLGQSGVQDQQDGRLMQKFMFVCILPR